MRSARLVTRLIASVATIAVLGVAPGAAAGGRGPSAGVDYTFSCTLPSLPGLIYTVVINDFMASGGDRLGFGTAAISSMPANIADLDAFVAYLSSLPQPIREPSEPRIISRP